MLCNIAKAKTTINILCSLIILSSIFKLLWAISPTFTREHEYIFYVILLLNFSIQQIQLNKITKAKYEYNVTIRQSKIDFVTLFVKNLYLKNIYPNKSHQKRYFITKQTIDDNSTLNNPGIHSHCGCPWKNYLSISNTTII